MLLDNDGSSLFHDEPMAAQDVADHYEILQLSPRADQGTIQRVFRHLAKRFHPDNHESGDADRFKQVMEAFKVLSDPERRAQYDARYEDRREARWRIFDQGTVTNDVGADQRVRDAALSLLYAARRNDPDQPGLGTMDLERLLGCPEEHLRFHIWYLKENSWIQRLDNGMIAITARGVDRVLDQGPIEVGMPLLTPVRVSHPASRNGAA
jgi:DnaJ-like protein